VPIVGIGVMCSSRSQTTSCEDKENARNMEYCLMYTAIVKRDLLFQRNCKSIRISDASLGALRLLTSSCQMTAKYIVRQRSTTLLCTVLSLSKRTQKGKHTVAIPLFPNIL
jgi:hypothetical protein